MLVEMIYSINSHYLNYVNLALYIRDHALHFMNIDMYNSPYYTPIYLHNLGSFHQANSRDLILSKSNRFLSRTYKLIHS